MSVFDDIPEAFPLDVPLTRLPVSYTLRLDNGERIVTLGLAAFWLLLVPGLILLSTDAFTPWQGGSDTLIKAGALLASVAYLALALRYWLGPAIAASLRQAEVTITPTQVAARVKGLGGTQSWSRPLAEYEGVALVDRGTLAIGERKFPVAAVVLKHAQEAFSVPIVIGEARKVDARAVARKARQLGIAAIDGTLTAATEQPLAAGTIVVNRFQAFKLRALSWALSLSVIGGATTCLWHGWNESLDPACVILSALGAAVVAAMHAFAAHYVVTMREAGDAIEIDTAAVVRSRHRLTRDRIVALSHREGRTHTPRHRVHAPWLKLSIAGRRWPFVIDLQSDYVDEQRLEALRNPARR